MRTRTKRPLQLLAVQVDVQLAGRDSRRRVGALVGFPRPRVPDDDVAAAVLPGRDHALEVDVLQRVVLDVEGGSAHIRVERRSLRDGPADEHARDLEPEVVVQPPGPVSLHHESRCCLLGGCAASSGRCTSGGLPGRLVSLREVPLRSVLREPVGRRHTRASPSHRSGRSCLPRPARLAPRVDDERLDERVRRQADHELHCPSDRVRRHHDVVAQMPLLHHRCVHRTGQQAVDACWPAVLVCFPLHHLGELRQRGLGRVVAGSVNAHRDRRDRDDVDDVRWELAGTAGHDGPQELPGHVERTRPG